MNLRSTVIVSVMALALLAAAWVTAPPRVTETFAERGELLFPQFRDPNAAASLEVVTFDPQTATVQPLKIQNRNGRWTLPSQHDYPADGGRRLAQAAAALINLRKDEIATDNSVDHARYGVLDPMDTSLAASEGRGIRLIVRGTADQLLADIVLGGAVARSPAFRYVRQPGQRRVYLANVGDLNVSTAFQDWIERNLLQVTPAEIDAVNLRSYSLDRGRKSVNAGETLLLQKSRAGDWTINDLRANDELDLEALDQWLANLVSLNIVGVMPKPAGITDVLRSDPGRATITQEDRQDLAKKGFYLTPDGQLLSNHGELVIRTVQGVFYTLRFGDIEANVGTGTAGGEPSSEARFLFVTVDFDEGSAATASFAREGSERVRLLRARFAPWYYVITAASLNDLQVKRQSLIKRRS